MWENINLRNDLKLTVRAISCLERKGIVSLGQVAKMSLEDIYGTHRAMTERYAREIQEKCNNAVGYKLINWFE